MTIRRRSIKEAMATDSAVTSATHATVSADIPINPPCRRIRVGTGGALALEYPNGDQDTIPALLDGECVDVQASKILDSGTTCANVTIFW